MNEQGRLFPAPRKPPKEPERDEVWDTLTEYFGEPLTKSARGRRNGAVKELRDAGLTAEQIRVGIDYCKRNFTHFTEMAVCMWIGRALHEKREDVFGENVIELAFKRRMEEK